jgi:hypothetical protein
MKNTAKKERCKDSEMMSEYFESHFITIDTVAYALGVSTKTIERWQSRENDPLRRLFFFVISRAEKQKRCGIVAKCSFLAY